MAAIYIGSALLICGLILSMVVTNMSIEKSLVPFKDFIGPVFDLIGIIILAWALREQLKMNEKQFEAIETTNTLNKFNQLVNLIDDTEKNIQEYSINVRGLAKKTYKGREAFDLMSFHFQKMAGKSSGSMVLLDPLEASTTYTNILRVCIFIIDSIQKYESSNDLSKETLQIKYINMISKLELHISEMRESTRGVGDIFMRVIHEYTTQIQNKLAVMRRENNELMQGFF